MTTNSDQKTGKPAVAKSAKATSAPKPVAKPAAVKAPAVKAPDVKAPVSVAKVEAPAAVKPAAAKPVAAKTPAPEAITPKAVAPKVVAPKVEPVQVELPAQTAAPQAPTIENSPAPVAPVAEAVVAALPEKPISKPVEAPVSSTIAPKASTIPPLPFFMVPKMSTQTFKGYEDFAAFGKANLEAFVQANQLFTKGIESLSKEVVSLAQSSLESSTAATKAIFAAKTIKDVVELQADFAKTSFEKLVANSTKLGEMTVKLATDSTAPIGARVTAASEKALKPVA